MYFKARASCLVGLLLFITYPVRGAELRIDKEGAALAVGAAGAATFFALSNHNRQAERIVAGLGFTPKQAQGMAVLLTPLFAMEALGFDSLSWAKWLALIVAVSKSIQGVSRLDQTSLPFLIAVTLITVFTFVQEGIELSTATMTEFIGMFLAVFGTLKAIDFDHFAPAFKSYDVVASFIPLYAYIYPIIEFGLGAAYLSDKATELATHIAQGLTIVGVISALYRLIKTTHNFPNHLLGVRVAPALAVIETIGMGLLGWPHLASSVIAK